MTTGSAAGGLQQAGAPGRRDTLAWCESAQTAAGDERVRCGCHRFGREASAGLLRGQHVARAQLPVVARFVHPDRRCCTVRCREFDPGPSVGAWHARECVVEYQRSEFARFAEVIPVSYTHLTLPT